MKTVGTTVSGQDVPLGNPHGDGYKTSNPRSQGGVVGPAKSIVQHPERSARPAWHEARESGADNTGPGTATDLRKRAGLSPARESGHDRVKTVTERGTNPVRAAERGQRNRGNDQARSRTASTGRTAQNRGASARTASKATRASAASKVPTMARTAGRVARKSGRSK